MMEVMLALLHMVSIQTYTVRSLEAEKQRRGGIVVVFCLDCFDFLRHLGSKNEWPELGSHCQQVALPSTREMPTITVHKVLTETMYAKKKPPVCHPNIITWLAGPLRA